MTRLVHLSIGLLLLTVLWQGAAFRTRATVRPQRSKLAALPNDESMRIAPASAPLVLCSTRHWNLLLQAKSRDQKPTNENNLEPPQAYVDTQPDSRRTVERGSVIPPLFVGRALTPEVDRWVPGDATDVAPRGRVLGVSTEQGFIGF